MFFVNLTPHTLTITVGADSLTLAPSPSGAARVTTVETMQGILPHACFPMGIPVVSRSFGSVEGLPSPQHGVAYLVSSVVLDALKGSGRTDVFAPDSGSSAVRNEKGHVVAVMRLVSVS